jgi:hypothetical protein
MRFPDQRFSIVILANQGPFPDYEIASDIAILYLKDLIKEPLDKKQRTSRDREDRTSSKKIQPTSEQLMEYAGSYYSEELDATYTIYSVAKKLIMRVGRYYTTSIACVKPDEFIWSFRNIDFNRNQSGEISGFLLHEGPIRDLKFKKRK